MQCFGITLARHCSSLLVIGNLHVSAQAFTRTAVANRTPTGASACVVSIGKMRKKPSKASLALKAKVGVAFQELRSQVRYIFVISSRRVPAKRTGTSGYSGRQGSP
jgi:hypothetical protein